MGKLTWAAIHSISGSLDRCRHGRRVIIGVLVWVMLKGIFRISGTIGLPASTTKPNRRHVYPAGARDADTGFLLMRS